MDHRRGRACRRPRLARPRLSVRHVETSRQPLKVVVDSALDISDAARLFDGNPVLLVGAAADPAKAERYARKNGQVAALPGKDGRVDLAELMRELGRRGINELHVEAGATLNGALVQAGLADELLMYLAPVLIGPGRPLLELPALDDLSAARRLQVHELSRVGADIRLIARFSN